jgi:hypothetical protein
LSDKQRIIDLQKQVRIGKLALQKIAAGGRDPEDIAGDAMSEIMSADRPVDRAPLAGILGWERGRV